AAMGADRAVRPRWLVVVAAVMCVDPLLRTLPLLESAPFDLHQVPYDRAIGRDAKFIRIGFGGAQMANRRAWIAGYLNLYERRFDAWTAGPMGSRDYVDAYEAAMMERSGAKLKSMSVGYIITQIDGKIGALGARHAFPFAFLR